MSRPVLLLATPPNDLPPSLVSAAVDLARALAADVEVLTVDTAYEDVHPRTGLAKVAGAAAKVRVRTESVFAKPIARLREAAHEVRLEVTFGHPAQGIVRRADILKPAFILVATRGRVGVRRALLGSVSEGVLRGASCPVVVVPPKASLE